MYGVSKQAVKLYKIVHSVRVYSGLEQLYKSQKNIHTQLVHVHIKLGRGHVSQDSNIHTGQ